MAVAYSVFGLEDKALYQQYLWTFHDVAGVQCSCVHGSCGDQFSAFGGRLSGRRIMDSDAVIGGHGFCEGSKPRDKGVGCVEHGVGELRCGCSAGVDAHGDGACSGGSSGGKVEAKSEQGGGVGDTVTVRGKHWKRNQEKKKKKKRNSGSGELGSSLSLGPKQQCGQVGHGRVGYFHGLSDDVQRELKESRAMLLIEENKRRLAQEQEKLRALDQTTPEYLAREYLRVMALAGKMKELKDEKVGRWATVVAESMVHTVATSAPSSVPTLESVGFGNSALKSSDGSSASERKTLFEAEKLCLESHFQSLDFYLPADYANALGRLKEDFADVVFEQSVADRVKEKRGVEKFVSANFDGAMKEKAFLAYRSEYEDIIQLCGTD